VEHFTGHQDATQVFWVELDAHKLGVIANLNDLSAIALGILPNEREADSLQFLNHLGVGLAAMAKALGNLGSIAIQGAQLRPLGPRLEYARVFAQLS
jgi:hypothetical protein